MDISGMGSLKNIEMHCPSTFSFFAVSVDPGTMCESVPNIQF